MILKLIPESKKWTWALYDYVGDHPAHPRATSFCLYVNKADAKRAAIKWATRALKAASKA